MRALLIYPEFPDNFWGFKYALKIISKKATEPPLGLLTVAALLPEDWEKRLLDMNVKKLRDKDLEWADLVFVGAMVAQQESARDLISRCKILGIKVVAGGPLFTTNYHEFEEVDHLVLNEAEVTLPPFLEDLKKGEAKKIYTSKELPDLSKTPAPMWDLINMNKYATVDIQYSRGCPYDCEFCDITVLYGKKVRTKTKEQVVNELERIYSSGWRGGVFFVDDNFIGNKKKLKNEVLPAIIEWMKARGKPFTFSTEASIDLSDDEELMNLMGRAGFNSVFVGVETVDEDSLTECNKIQNKNRDLIACVKHIQNHGIAVNGGFIVGFDSDQHSIFKRMSDFIQESGIVTAMVGLLNAPRGTRLYKRLVSEGRLIDDSTGSNTDFSINFVPKMNRDTLIMGIKSIVNHIYAPKHYYKRVKLFLREFKPFPNQKNRINPGYLWAFVKSSFFVGVLGKERLRYWSLLLWTLFRRPRLMPLAVTMAVYGFHFRKIYEDCS